MLNNEDKDMKQQYNTNFHVYNIIIISLPDVGLVLLPDPGRDDVDDAAADCGLLRLPADCADIRALYAATAPAYDEVLLALWRRPIQRRID